MIFNRHNKKKDEDIIYILRAKEYQNTIDIYFENLHHLLYHEIILNVLKEDLKCEVLSYVDKITDIGSTIRWNGIEFDFPHDYMFGNYFIATPEHADALEQLANQAADIINEKISTFKKGKKTHRT